MEREWAVKYVVVVVVDVRSCASVLHIVGVGALTTLFEAFLVSAQVSNILVYALAIH